MVILVCREIRSCFVFLTSILPRKLNILLIWKPTNQFSIFITHLWHIYCPLVHVHKTMVNNLKAYVFIFLASGRTSKFFKVSVLLISPSIAKKSMSVPSSSNQRNQPVRYNDKLFNCQKYGIAMVAGHQTCTPVYLQ